MNNFHQGLTEIVNRFVATKRDDSHLIAFRNFEELLGQKPDGISMGEAVEAMVLTRFNNACDIVREHCTGEDITPVIDQICNYLNSISGVQKILDESQFQKYTKNPEQEISPEQISRFAEWMGNSKKILSEAFQINDLDSIQDLLIEGYNNLIVPKEFNKVRYERLAELIKYAFNGIGSNTNGHVSLSEFQGCCRMMKVLGPTSGDIDFEGHFNSQSELLVYAAIAINRAESFAKQNQWHMKDLENQAALLIAKSSWVQVYYNCSDDTPEQKFTKGSEILLNVMSSLGTSENPEACKVERDFWMHVARFSKSNPETVSFLLSRSGIFTHTENLFKTRQSVLDNNDTDRYLIIMLPGTPEALLNIAKQFESLNKNLAKKLVTYADQIIGIAEECMRRLKTDPDSPFGKYYGLIRELRKSLN